MRRRTLSALCALPLLAGCGLTANPDRDYVTADRATYEALASPVSALIDDDPTNDPDLTVPSTRMALEGVLATWLVRIEAQERRIAGEQP